MDKSVGPLVWAGWQKEGFKCHGQITGKAMDGV